MHPLVSVCVPVYNTAQYLEQCLESLFNQTIADKCEFIIVNDCSPDNSAIIIKSIIEKYKNLNINVITHGKNKGLAAVRNTALNAANGEYCINIDSDDWCEQNYIESLLKIAKQKNADIVISQCNLSFENEKNIDYVKKLLNHEIPVVIWTKLIKRSLFTNNNISWIEGINVGEDTIISTKLLYHAKNVVTIPDDLYHYRQSIGFVTKLKKINWLEQKKKEFDELERFFREKNCFEQYKDIIELRKAEIKYDFIKVSPVFSIKKYSVYYPELKLSILYKFRKEFNKKNKKLFINFIDSKNYFIANIFLLIYKITGKK